MTATLSPEERKRIQEFFNNNKSLYTTFIDLFNYQASMCDGTTFIDLTVLIGFGRINESARCYITKESSGYLIKFLTCDEAVEFRKKDFDCYRLLLITNDAILAVCPEKYKLSSKPTSYKSTKKKSQTSQGENDTVLSKLKNRNHARKFTLQDFNALADWSYCSSFNENGYIYTLPNGNKIECDSKSEIKLLDYLTTKKVTLAIGAQNLLIKYSSAYRNNLDFYPDIVILTKDNHIAIIEVKPVTSMSYHKNVEKYDAMKEYCEENGYEYMMVDPDHKFMTYDDLLNLHIPNEIIERVDDYLINLIGKYGACLLEKEDIPILYKDFSDDYKKGEFELYLHALVIQNGWYNKFKHGFMVFEKPNQ